MVSGAKNYWQCQGDWSRTLPCKTMPHPNPHFYCTQRCRMVPDAMTLGLLVTRLVLRLTHDHQCYLIRGMNLFKNSSLSSSSSR
eukprot:scaffold23464_cov126-Cylindrotheca_fusiformis.AAC.8